MGRAVRTVAAASRVALVSLTALMSAACAPDRPARLDAARGASERPWSRARCAPRIDATLAEWGAGPEYLGSPPDRTGATTIRLPTSELGHWAVVIVQQHDGEPTVDLVSNNGLMRRQFGDDCSVQERRSDGFGLVDAFGDEELRTALEGARRGVVVYAWSPHMPLSVDGWVEVEAASLAAGLDVIPVRFQGGDTDFAQREAERVGMPARAVTEIGSVELVMRDLQVHAPSILVFADGRVSPVLPGYRNAEGYRRFLENFFGEHEPG